VNRYTAVDFTLWWPRLCQTTNRSGRRWTRKSG